MYKNFISCYIQCASIPAIYHLIQQTDPSQPTKLMILGPACSSATKLMGEIAQRFMNITQVWHCLSHSLCHKHHLILQFATILGIKLM